MKLAGHLCFASCGKEASSQAVNLCIIISNLAFSFTIQCFKPGPYYLSVGSHIKQICEQIKNKVVPL